MYDATVFKIRTLVPSGRGELEITDVNNAYIEEGTMTFSFLEGWWTDAGTFDSLLRAANLVARSAGWPSGYARGQGSGANLMAGQNPSAMAVRRIASSEGLELAVPICAKGLGSVIVKPDSADLIQGVRVRPFPIYPDDRGYFLEVQRIGAGLAAEFPPETTKFPTRPSVFLGRSRPFTTTYARRIAGLPPSECSRWLWWTSGWARQPSACATRCILAHCAHGKS